MRVPIGVPGGGVLGRVQVSGGFLCGERGKRGRGRGGWGPAKEPASQCAHVCQNYPLVSRTLKST